MYKNNEANGKERSEVTADSECVVTMTAPVSAGVTYELCAGLVDQKLPLEKIAQQEVLEETGYWVPLNQLKRITSYFGNVAISGNVFTLFFAEVTEDMRKAAGGGNLMEGEKIELYYLPVKEVKNFVLDESIPKPSSVVAALMWYLSRNHGNDNGGCILI